MSAFLGISLWVALATVVPGLVTMTVVYICLVTASVSMPETDSDWVIAGFAVTLMVLTQALGILLEELLTRRHLLGPNVLTVWVPHPDSPGDFLDATIRPYDQYKGLYIVLAQMTESDDSQGHLKRALAQYFLTNNTLVSFATGVILALSLPFFADAEDVTTLRYFAVGFFIALVLSYWVGVIRFHEMVKSLWAVQTRHPLQKVIDETNST